MNVIQQENIKVGTKDWELTSPILPGDRDPNTFRCRVMEGYASLTSVNLNETIKFYVSTTDPQFSMQFYRLGWYGGKGGRFMAEEKDIRGKDQATPQMGSDGLLECSWEVSHSLKIPEDWVSGIYVAKLTAQQSKKQSYIIFVVRDDERASDYLFQSSVTTFQAYNNWGGKSIYNYNCDQNFNNKFFQNQSAKAVSFDRPYAVPAWLDGAGGAGAGDFFTHDYDGGSYAMMHHSATWEYNMVRWLEAEGYDVTYCTNIDTHANPKLLLSHRGFLSVGHDEYWSQEMFDNVSRARDRGINLAFFSANSVYWRIRMQPSTVTRKPNRSFYLDKTAEVELFQNLVPPEKTLVGASGDWGLGDTNIVITAEDHWVYQGTNLKKNDKLPGLVGYEYNGLPSEGTLPPGLVSIAASDTAHYNMTVYQVASGATVFSANTIQWAWGLDDYCVPLPPASDTTRFDPHFKPRGSRQQAAAQQITRNVLNRFAKPRQGVLNLWRPNAQGSFSQPTLTKGVSSTWHTIVPGKFSNSAATDLLFYNAIAGEIAFYSVDLTGKLTPIGSILPRQRQTWSAIIPGNFTDSPYTDLLFYDAIAGEIAIYSTNGRGNLTRLKAGMIGCRQTWYSIVPGKFSNSPYTDLFFYDAINGESTFYSTQGKGELILLGDNQQEQRWYLSQQRQTWHSIIPGKFSNSPYTDLLFYDDSVGGAEFCSVDGNGKLNSIRTIPANYWRKTWSMVASGNFSNSIYSDLMFYEGFTGDLSVFSMDDQGNFSEITASLPLGRIKSWQSVVLLNQFGAPSGMLVYDRYEDKPNGPL